MTCNIRIFIANNRGIWENAGGNDYTAEELGGVPVVGDMILDPGVTKRNDEERPNFDDPDRRRVYVVKARFFRPLSDRHCKVETWVSLLCEERTATLSEVNLI